MLANMARLQSDMTKTKDMVGNAMSSVERSVNMAKRALGALGIGLSAVLFTRLIRGALDTQDELSKLSQKVGIAVESLVGLRHAGELSGVSFEGMQKGLKTLSTMMFDASMGLLESKRNFSVLNIEIKDTDGSLKSAEAVMIEVADRFKEMDDGTLKTALAVKLFGRAGLDLIPMLNMGSAALAEMVEQGKALNPITAESAKQAEVFNDNMSILVDKMKSYGIVMLNDVLPVVSELAKMFAEQALQGDIKKTADAAKGLDNSFKILPETFKVITILGGNVSFVLKGIGRELGGMMAQMAALATGDFAGFSAIRQALIEDGKKARQELDAWEQRIMALGTGGAAAAGGGRRGGGGVGGGAVDEAAAKARLKAAQEAAVEMAKIAMADLEEYENTLRFKSEMDMQAAEEAERLRQEKLELIREHLAEERSLVQAGAQFWIDTERAKIEQQAQMEQQVRDMRMTTWQMGAELLMQFAGKSKTAAIAVIAINKALAIAQTIQSTSVAVMRAFAELGPIAGAPVAASMKALGAIQVGIIAATGLFQAANLGGGGAAAGTPANPISTQPVGNAQATGRTGGQTTIVNLHGQTYTRAQVRELLEIQNENSVDGSRTVVVER
jgi:hypothetical protein